MKDLRPLLIDCRIELRKHLRDFQKTELCERLDLILQSLTDAPMAPVAAPATNANAAAAPEKAQTVSQVALAWQTAARDLKFTEPATYQRLSDKVMRLLGSKTLVDPATEILQLQAEAEALRQRAETDAQTLRQIELERDTLLSVLAEAVPELAGQAGTDRLSVGLAQIEQLRSQGPSRPTAGGKVAASAPAEPSTPTPDILTSVAGGVRKFSDDQRNWAVGEGMVLSGFQYTPVELLELGDQKLAALILEKQGS